MDSDKDPAALPRSTPAEQGVDIAGIDAFIAAVAPKPGVELHSLMVLRHGHVVAERWWPPYSPQTPHLLYSLSKSFTSTALGYAVSEGLVDLDATVLSYFPEFDSTVTDERSRAIRVRHVAAMASGHDDETFERAIRAGNGDIVLGFLLVPPDREPGTVFAYNQPCTYAVSAIIQRVSGGSLTEFLRPRLYEPLGIAAHGWHTDGRGRELGFTGLHATTESIAKLGELYLREGVWNDRRLLSAEWVAEATRSHVATHRPEPTQEEPGFSAPSEGPGAGGSTAAEGSGFSAPSEGPGAGGSPDPDWAQGYGFQFWRSRHGYRGDGAYGQFMLILPDADAVVAITSQSPDMQGLLDEVWTHLLPALTAGSSPSGLPRPASDGPPGEVGPLTLRPGPGNELAGLHTVRLRAGELVLADAGPELVARLGDPDTWTTTGPVATAYAWADGRLLVDVVFVETPHRLHLSLDPTAGQFEARWQTVPLGDVPLSSLRMPG